jgi:hypothetical protein
VKLIQIQPEPVIDNIWGVKTGEIVFGEQLPYPFAVKDNGDVDGQDFWRGDPAAVLGFQDDEEVQRINLWWEDAKKDPQSIVGKFPVMRTDKGKIYTYTVKIESVEVFEVPA